MGLHNDSSTTVGTSGAYMSNENARETETEQDEAARHFWERTDATDETIGAGVKTMIDEREEA